MSKNGSILTSIIFSLFLSIPALSQSEDSVSVSLLKVEMSDVNDIVVYPLRISPAREISILSEINGIVRSVEVEIGSRIRKGQVVVNLSNTEPLYSFRPMPIFSPIEGVVARIDISQNEIVNRGKILVVVSDLKMKKMIIHLTNDDRKKIAIGTKGSLRVGDNEFDILVKAMSPYADVSSGTAQCELEFAKSTLESTRLDIGDIGKVTFSINHRRTVLLPENVIHYKGKKPFVLKVESDNKIQFLPIFILGRRSGEVEIDGKELVGKNIVKDSESFLEDGMSVTVQSPEGG